ncbi:hypothetical protein [Amphibiibacter pelophylacis]|uniref:Uncharacterized protein n=1 Tax=Amphibiibacter pelophylacis TaxID=1799477 RepID=A0ACC6P2T4_9BURK
MSRLSAPALIRPGRLALMTALLGLVLGTGLALSPTPARAAAPGAHKNSVKKQGAQKHAARKIPRGSKKTVRQARAEAVPALPTVHLSPRVRTEALGPAGVAPVMLATVRPFLSRSQILPDERLAAAPRIVALPERRALVSLGDTVYARGGELQTIPTGTLLQIYRMASPVKDPVTGEVLGHETRAVGEAELIARGHDSDPQIAAAEVPYTLRIVRASDEVLVGDRLAPLPAHPLTGVALDRFIPHAPAVGQEGLVVSVPDHGEAGPNQLVIVNRGQQQGLQVGDVFDVMPPQRVTTDPTSPGQVVMSVPGEKKATLMLVHVFDKASYALVMNSVWPVRPGDSVVAPTSVDVGSAR